MIKPELGVVENRAKISRKHEDRTLIRIIGDRLREHVWAPPRANDRIETQDRLVKMIEATPDFIITIDVKGHVLYCNRAVRQMLGMSCDEDSANLHITDIYSARSCATVLGEGVFIANLDGEWSGEAALLTRAGQEIPVSQVIIAPQDADRRCEFLALIARDVQDMKPKSPYGRANSSIVRSPRELQLESGSLTVKTRQLLSTPRWRECSAIV